MHTRLLLLGAVASSSGCDGFRTYTNWAPRVVVLDGRAAESLVYRVDVPATAHWLTIRLHDTLPPVGPESGLDIDAVIVSDVRCTTATCVVDAAGENHAPRLQSILFPGAILGDAGPLGRLVGTTPGGQFLDPRAATLDRLDANREHRAGFVSLGQDGEHLVGFDPPLERGGHVYVALVGRPTRPERGATTARRCTTGPCTSPSLWRRSTNT